MSEVAILEIKAVEHSEEALDRVIEVFQPLHHVDSIDLLEVLNREGRASYSLAVSGGELRLAPYGVVAAGRELAESIGLAAVAYDQAGWLLTIAPQA
ncbi:hypothetical protein SAMN02745225_00995 [Ferrithrix thermotolerans DSM 19514]|jgi:hypothetical protein|uniref:Uncharacterized protein n=1 Tax=Ferrithrix thermotolerans DSM 19514 TaxID=1121881 RepID=A0A1M4UIK6_9ACTN|nr:hypothetical protein [Ferrithrix thermotolerans]SHE56488.1 hypothetical protein SAMN02745225_00995 [Ferrithrix thermotolerans DSM 19514]